MRHSNWAAARRHLQQDPVLRRIIADVGACGLKPRRDHFVLLCRAIYSQQISTAVARVLFGRFRQRFPGLRPTPARVLNLLTNGKEDELKSCGLSRQKKAYLIDLAQHFVDKRIPRRLSSMSDEAIIECLTAVKGIGRWTAEMFLIFILNRPDVLPVDDLGLQIAVQKVYRLKHRPRGGELMKLGERWRPYRTVAAWYLWRSLDKPKKKTA
ncbi:MAG: DNA-3-methyladenine glycosylase [Planctomycetota bacterium]|nr:DNA-3-methyladenine glycosylase [Planctomycetota bacterium]